MLSNFQIQHVIIGCVNNGTVQEECVTMEQPRTLMCTCTMIFMDTLVSKIYSDCLHLSKNENIPLFVS